MRLLASFQRPEYVYRPLQILRRMKYGLGPNSAKYETVTLPWGLPFRIEPAEALGRVILRCGVYDLHTCEFIARLLDPGEIAIDGGANIGQMSSIMAVRSGPRGQVIAVEPHPGAFAELEFNTGLWSQRHDTAPLELHQAALSDRPGVVKLMIPRQFGDNHMLAFVDDDERARSAESSYEVPRKTLDEIVGERKVGLLKLDVELHEYQVLKGAKRLIESRSIRDILFEEQRTPPTPATEFLEAAGYTLFEVSGTLAGPVAGLVASPDAHYGGATAGTRPRSAPSLAATLDPARLAARTRPRGWASLHNLARI